MIGSGTPLWRLLLVMIPFLLWCWLAMLLTHELGHVIAVPLTGGELAYVNVYPGRIPSTLASPNPAPSVVLWGGFVSGVLTPLAVAAAGRLIGAGPLPPAWAGFCLFANGAYLACGGLESFADSALLIKVGWPVWLLAPVGSAVAASGYVMCRRSWPRVVEQLSAPPASVKTIAGVWSGLLLWIAAQWLLAEWLTRVVRG